MISAESKGLWTIEKGDVSSANNFAKNSKLWGISFMYTHTDEKAKVQVLSSVGLLSGLVKNLRNCH